MAKILVADDNSNIQKMVGLALKDQGIDVVAVGNGEAAVRKISDVHPDLVLADVFMPVRNGYEVCRYVKEDSALSHIPVILLVGAFDPLDEQEAQRVGADGVLKKPFVPPDPLISMVKSALTRAGVSLSPTSATPSTGGDRAAAPLRMGHDIIGGPSPAKTSAPTPPIEERLPEPMPEPAEEFPAPPAQVKIPEGHGPIAFGNLLDAAEPEEEPQVFSSKPMIEITEERNWSDEQKDTPEEEEPEAASGWHPSGLDEASAPQTESVPDWRDEAFHGTKPAKGLPSVPWTPTREKTEIVPEPPETEAVAVFAADKKPANGTSPFLSDAWASTIAAGVEQKFAKEETVKAPAVSAPAAPPVTNGSTLSSPFKSLHESAPPVVETKAIEEKSLPAVPESSWESEAKRAASLAATWDAPVSEPPALEPVAPALSGRSPDETQDIPVYAEEPAGEEPIVPAVDEAPQTSAYSGHIELEHEEPAPVEAQAPAMMEEPVAADTDLDIAHDGNMLSSAHIAPNPEILLNNGSAGMEELAEQPEPAVATPEFASPSVANAAPDMDELVARVLGKMNPEVLQKVTREILKPVIEAIVRDELESKK